MAAGRRCTIRKLGLLVLSMLLMSPLAAKERQGELQMRRDLQTLGGQLLEIARTFATLAEGANGKTSYDLLYEEKDANELFFHVYHVRTILDLAMGAESKTDESTIRSVLVREAKDLVVDLDLTIKARVKAKEDLPRPEYLRQIDSFVATMEQLRVVVARIANDGGLVYSIHALLLVVRC